MNTFEELLDAARRLPEVEKRRLIAEVETKRPDGRRDTLRGFAIGPLLFGPETNHPDFGRVADKKGQ